MRKRFLFIQQRILNELQAKAILLSKASLFLGLGRADLVFFSSLAFTFAGVHADFFVILLQGGQIFTSF